MFSCSFFFFSNYQRWSRGHKARGQGHKKKSEAKAKDSLSEDRHSRGQGQECSRPRPRTKDQRWSRGHKARGQGQGHKKNPRPRPRTAFPRTDALEAKDRNARGQGPRTQSASALQEKKKGLHKNFSGDLVKKKKKKKKRSSQKFFKR